MECFTWPLTLWGQCVRTLLYESDTHSHNPGKTWHILFILIIWHDWKHHLVAIMPFSPWLRYFILCVFVLCYIYTTKNTVAVDFYKSVTYQCLQSSVDFLKLVLLTTVVPWHCHLGYGCWLRLSKEPQSAPHYISMNLLSTLNGPDAPWVMWGVPGGCRRGGGRTSIIILA